MFLFQRNIFKQILLPILFVVLHCCASLANTQDVFVHIKHILLEGNKKTKSRIILREMNIQEGDSIRLDQLMDRLKENELLIYNTALFNDVKVNVKDWVGTNHNIAIEVTVLEAWYIFPVPILEIADRNFNVWWTEQNRSLQRINYGLHTTHRNLSGRNDFLKVVTQLGYTQKFEVEYTRPFINKKQSLGFSAVAHYSRNKEVAARTQANKLEFRQANYFQFYRSFIGGELSLRPGLFAIHSLSLRYHKNHLDERTVVELDPHFFLNQKSQQQYFTAAYQLNIDQRDFYPYPAKGFMLRAGIEKTGLSIFDDINKLEITASHTQYVSLHPRIIAELKVKGKVALIREQQPYYNYRALGYSDDFLRGYEFYVIDGSDYGYAKASLHFLFFEREINLGRHMPLKNFKILPLKVYLSLNNDWGYVLDDFYAAGNPFVNTTLKSFGLGLDFLTYNTQVVQIQYTWNHINESGLFLHYKLSF